MNYKAGCNSSKDYKQYQYQSPHNLCPLYCTIKQLILSVNQHERVDEEVGRKKEPLLLDQNRRVHHFQLKRILLY